MQVLYEWGHLQLQLLMFKVADVTPGEPFKFQQPYQFTMQKSDVPFNIYTDRPVTLQHHNQYGNSKQNSTQDVDNVRYRLDFHETCIFRLSETGSFNRA